MSDAIDRAAKVIATALSRHGGAGSYADAARALDRAGLLSTPEHDRQVAARALRDAAEAHFYDGDRDLPLAGYVSLHNRADRIQFGGETDAGT